MCYCYLHSLCSQRTICDMFDLHSTEKKKEEKKETKKKEEKPAAKPKPFLPTIKEFSEGKIIF